MVDPTIRVANLGQFKEFITDLGSPPEGLTGRYLHPGEGVEALTTGADEVFKELKYLNESVEHQSQQLALFVKDVQAGYAGAVEMVNFIGSNYYNAEMYSGQKLREPMSRAEAEKTNLAEIGQEDGLAHKAHGWPLYGLSPTEQSDLLTHGTHDWTIDNLSTGMDTLDRYQEQHEMGGYTAPPAPKRTDWQDPGRSDWDRGDSGEAFRHVHYVFQMMEPRRMADRATRWADLAKALRAAALDLQRSTDELTNTWSGPAADGFHKRMAEAISSVQYWEMSVTERAKDLKSTAGILAGNKELIDGLKEGFEKAVRAREEARGLAFAEIDVLRTYDAIAIWFAGMLSDHLVHNAESWSAPPRYPGFTSDTPLLPPTAGPTGAPPGPGGGPPGTAGGPPGGGPMPGNRNPNNNAQKIVDGIRNKYEEAMKKQQKEYERALKAQQDAAAKMKKQYEDALAKEREAATKQAEDLQKGLRDAQQGLPPGLDAGPQGLDDALRQQQELLDSLGTPPQSIEDLTRDLGRAMENVGLDPSAVSALPAYLNGLGGLGGLGGSAVGLPAASNSPDLLGRGGTTPAATTGLGASALTGRMMPGATPGAGMGMGGMPMMPPMGGMPMGGGGAAPLSGRKNRPPLPGEETQKPASRPRIVDPAGDGNTETRPARAGDRRAAVAQPTKAPEAEPGQALGRTA